MTNDNNLTLNHMVSFCNGCHYVKLEQFISKRSEFADHLMKKLDSYCKQNGGYLSKGALMQWITELDDKHRHILTDYILLFHKA